MAAFENQLKNLSIEHDHVDVKFLGYQGDKKEVAKIVLKVTEKNKSNLILVTLPNPPDAGCFFVESSVPTFDSEVNGYAAGKVGLSLTTFIQFCAKLYYQSIAGGDDLMDVSDAEEETWDEPDEDAWGDEDITEDPTAMVGMTAHNKEAEKYSAWKLKLNDKATELRKENASNVDKDLQMIENQMFKPESVAMMLCNQIIEYQKQYDKGDKSVQVIPIDDNIYEWKVKFSNFASESQIYLDLMKLGNTYGEEWNCVEMRVSFLMELFPIYPPKVRLVRPRLENFMFGRIVCMEELQVAKWNPVRTLEDIFNSIRHLIQKSGHVDLSNPVNNPKNERPPFTEMEYQLLRLSMLTEVPFRANTLISDDDYKMSTLPSIGSKFFANKKDSNEPPKKKQKTHHNYYGDEGGNYKAWAKGTGYGHALDQDDWDMQAWKLAQLKKDSEIQSILELVLTELSNNKDKGLTQEALLTIFEESCIIPFLKEYLKNDSLIDIIQHHEKLYHTIYSIVKTMAKYPLLLKLFHDKCRSPSTTNVTIAELLESLYQTASLTSKLTGNTSGGLFATVKLIITTHETAHAAMEKHKIRADTDMEEKNSSEKEKNQEKETSGNNSNKDKELYVATMKKLRFATVGNEDPSFLKTHHYASNSTETNKTFITRLGFEYADLNKSLPIDADSSVFLRVHESKMHFAKMLIVPCDGTPYGGGCFVFDAYFPPQYPDVAPKVNLMTTGRQSVRFNPNLYNCGKVCLSLLGTWHGGAQGENWNPGISTFLQVGVSIQSLIFVPEPYFNEPGYERSMGTPEGTKQSNAYNQNIQEQCVRWAMVDILQNPPKCFEDVIKAHFKLSKDRVLKNARTWLGAKHALVTQLEGLLKKL